MPQSDLHVPMAPQAFMTTLTLLLMFSQVACEVIGR